MTTVTVNTYTHSVVYVADNILKSLKDIIREVGLDPAKLMGDYETNMRALRAWLSSQDLRQVNLEIYDPATDALIARWDLDIAYGWSADDGNFWTDTDQLKYAIRKAGVVPSTARYRLLMDNKPGRPDVAGWSPATYRSTAGMVRQSLGSTIEHNGLGASAAYWRKT
jgi:hypothetical protein